MKQKVGLYWFTCDLRIQDNPLLWRASREVDSLLCIYCLPQMDSYLVRYSQEQSLGSDRLAFLQQSVACLSQSLENMGQQLIVCDDRPVDVLHRFIRDYDVTHLYCDLFSSVNEQSVVDRLSQLHSDLTCIQESVNTLFSQRLLSFTLGELPSTFTKFRKQVEHLPIGVESSLSLLPEQPAQVISTLNIEEAPCQLFAGGETQGLAHCLGYFATSLASHYKQTRNELDGFDFSTKFSPWLAVGCLSPRRIFVLLKEYEQREGTNDSTYWIFFELLWREYFHWYGKQWGRRLFKFSGVKDVAPLTSFYSYRFQQWKHGETQYPIVNACMNQLKATGYMSNRGRQLVASCLIHELGLDWRYGAAYFETQLVDYDVASNWGNWQYLAGVGADPRGSRHFNLAKQTEMYDPDKIFIERWRGNKAITPSDHVDMVDWPLSCSKGDE
ncbi:MAG: DASH family cryptochrome [Vibrio sp.]|uniref:DASH family cryptochrome n=1 Tax=Vibrio TaxID=662 RepID=UPI001EB94598|nr:DASH family cryptochrome [Vibrio sp.]NRB66013.1 DASH family cryptochrome [Vibrio sp.]